MIERAPKAFERDATQSVIVPGSRVIRSTEVAHVGGRHESHNQVATIELVTEGDVVRAIDVTCGCGQKMRLWCSYEMESDKSESGAAA